MNQWGQTVMALRILFYRSPYGAQRNAGMAARPIPHYAALHTGYISGVGRDNSLT